VQSAHAGRELDLPDVTMSIADVNAARSGQDGTVGQPRRAAGIAAEAPDVHPRVQVGNAPRERGLGKESEEVKDGFLASLIEVTSRSRHAILPGKPGPPCGARKTPGRIPGKSRKPGRCRTRDEVRDRRAAICVEISKNGGRECFSAVRAQERAAGYLARPKQRNLESCGCLHDAPATDSRRNGRRSKSIRG
jgi:hypothetical protein